LTVCGVVVELPVTLGAAVPVPFKVVICGDPNALSATESVAEKLAAEAGVKVTKMEQLVPAANEAPQALVPLVTAKSVGFVPAIVMPVIVNVALPVFESVATCAAVATSVADVKLSEGGVSEATGALTITVLKLAVTLCAAFIVTVVDALPVLATLPVQLMKL
jgi:hypothetical protein